MKNFNLKLIARLVCLLAVILSWYRAVIIIHSAFTDSKFSFFLKPEVILRPVVFSLLALMALFIAVKAKEARGRYLYALFIACLILNSRWLYQWITNDYIRVLIYSLENALTCTLFILANQHFPQQVTPAAVGEVFKIKLLRGYLNWLLKPANLWRFGTAIFLIASYAFTFFHLPEVIIDLVIIFSGFLFLYINYNRTVVSSRNSILWLFWGILSYTMLVIFSTLLEIFTSVPNPYLNLVIALLINFVLLIMVFMSVFFADSFDTGFIIKRTIIDGFLFLLVVLVYNFIEHYLLHIINEHLEINDGFISSLLSGVLVLVISPLHHRLEVFLNHKFKHHQEVAQH